MQKENHVSNFNVVNVDNLNVNEEVVNNNLMLVEDIPQPLFVLWQKNDPRRSCKATLDAAQNNLVHP